MWCRPSGRLGVVRRRGLPSVLAVAAISLASLASCGVQAGDARVGTASASKTPSTLSTAAVFDRIRPSIALIETPTGTGSSVLIDGGYLVTNAHVVDPFDQVDVQFEGEDVIRDVPVEGVDLVADIAVVGPVEVDAPPLDIVAPGAKPSGEAHLVGFPGEQLDASAVITDGHLVGAREADPWDLTYVESDADIGEGQSGGALVDGQGRVVGISGLLDAEDLALSLAGDDVDRSVAEILAGHGPLWTSIDAEATETTWRFRSKGNDEPKGWYLAPSADDRTITLSVEGDDPLVAVSEVGSSEWPTEASRSVIDLDGASYWAVDDEVGELDSPKPGTWTFDLDAYEEAIVTVASPQVGDDLRVTSSDALYEVPVASYPSQLGVGTTVRKPVSYFADELTFSVGLRKGEPVTITARSGSGDMAWTINDLADDASDDWTTEEDGGGGLLDLDASGRFVPGSTGTYYLYVAPQFPGSTQVEVSIEPA